jgi:hypothetical protein
MRTRTIIYCIAALGILACDNTQKSDRTVQDAAASGGAPEFAKEREVNARRGRMGAVTQATAPSVSLAAQDQGSPPVQIPPADAATPAMMIRTGYATLEVSKLDPAIDQVRALAAKMGGYVTNSSTSGGRDQVRAAMLEIRVPAQRYDEAVAALGAIGKVETTQTNAQDVGEEFVDVTARVENARKLEARLIELLANRTGRLQDVLSVERELSRVRTEIDQLEGRIRFLKNRVALSTLTVNLHEPQPLIGNTPGENPIAAAVRAAWRNFVGFVAAVIASLGVLIPLGVLGLLAWLGFKRWKVRGARNV